MSGKEDVISEDAYNGHDQDGIISRAVQYLFHQVRRDHLVIDRLSYSPAMCPGMVARNIYTGVPAVHTLQPHRPDDEQCYRFSTGSHPEGCQVQLESKLPGDIQ